MKLKPLALLYAAFTISTVGIPSTSIAQGCSLCRDATAGSAPQARRGMRRAIPLLGIPALGIFAGAIVLAVRIKPGRSTEGDAADEAS